MKKLSTQLISICMVLLVIGTNFTVAANDIPITSVKFYYHSISLDIYKQYQVVATVEPATASVFDLKWSSSNTSVAAVDSAGGIIAWKPGKAIIRAVSRSGKSDAMLVTVTPRNLFCPPNGAAYSGVNGLTGVKLPNTPQCLNFQDKSFFGAVSELDPFYRLIKIGLPQKLVSKSHKAIILKVYQNNTPFKFGTFDSFERGDPTNRPVIFLTGYTRNGYWWLKPESYTICCYNGKILFETISFHVNELGFC